MRIIAGRFKGRRLHAPSWEGVRPTSDKLRETLFNVLAPRIEGARVLDAYAGTGAIGIEALSRGASHVTFVDADSRAVKLIAQNLAQCGVSDRYAIIRARLSPQETLALAGRIAPASIDIAVLDPPYDEPDVAAALASIERWLAPGGILVLEHARRREPPERAGGLIRTRTITSGDSALAFFTAWEKTV